MMERAQAARAAGADDTAEERERLVRVPAIQTHPDLAHSWGAGSASACCAQAKLKEQAKERQQVELAERKRVAAQQEAAWVKFEQERQAIAEVEKAEEAKARAEASAMRRLAMMSGREPKSSDTPVENLKSLIGGKSSKKQKAPKSSKGGSARSKTPCARITAACYLELTRGYRRGPSGEPWAFGCRRGAVAKLRSLPTPEPA